MATTGTTRLAMTAEDLRRAVVRIAHEIVERNRGAETLVLVGIPRPGPVLAARLAAEIQRFERAAVPSGAIDITLYRDDLDRRTPVVHPSDIPVDLTDRDVVLVDDVLFTGRSVRAAMDALNEFGRPRTIQLAVIVDRGHRELPIRADYVGKNLPTAHDETVRVLLAELDGEDGVRLEPAPEQERPHAAVS
ncbi:MAG: bifunctional pyr operon transcriptional regulator/uracil phosphoribosyltransferase PyrR [Actinobacteria bacterium]|nr:bifunctional pyr operon transcriptional regulator/uracil phosphoribosyltransferase PyrR [Actinomycetota bacterium]